VRWREWLGVGERRWKKAPDEEVQPAKTLWDWLQLLIVPAILIGVTFAWSATQTRSDNKREDRRIAADRAAAEQARQDSTLQTYLDQMSGLMLHEKLLSSERGDVVRAVARTITLTALRRLDGERKREVVRFLGEAKLIDMESGPPVSLRGTVLTDAHLASTDLTGADLALAALVDADLRYASLGGADLSDANLEGADLRHATLTDATLQNANLERADLKDVELEEAYLEGANLKNAHLRKVFALDADLSDADLRDADLRDASLTNANFSNAYLTGADLTNAKLAHADFEGANLTNANLSNAYLKGADLTYTLGLLRTSGLDLDRYLTRLPPEWKKLFLDSHTFLDSLSREELAKFNLTPEKLATFRREAKAN
jgi:uncharacterized protein YjbI with pentapeptide repeats